MAPAPKPAALDATRLAPAPDPDALNFETTRDLAPLDDWLGQDRALDAIRMAAQTRHRDFNLFVLGTPGSGRHHATRGVLEPVAQGRAVPDDWVYVNNFETPHRPRALRLPPGMALRLKSAMETLIDDLANDIPALFESEDYQSRRHAIEQEFADKHETAMRVLFENARTRDVAILRTPMGYAVAAIRDNEVLTPEQFEKLPKPKQEAIEEKVDQTRKEMEAVLKELPRHQKDSRARVEELNLSIAEEAVDGAIGAAFADLRSNEVIQAHIGVIRKDLIENPELFLISEDGPRAGAFPVATTRHFAKPQFRRYLVNPMVAHDPATAATGAPIIEENLPTLANLIGRVEHISQMGTLVTDFSMIKPGALQRANGGYLILDARQVLSEPFAWGALKRSLKTGKVAIISAGEEMSLISTVSLEPDPIPLDVRVVLVGERELYYLLAAFDPDFGALFKLQADFSDVMPRTPAATGLYARLVATIAQRAEIRPLSPPGVARTLLESTRLADDNERLSLNIDRISDLLREADYCAARDGQPVIGAAEIDAAVTAAETRAGRVRDLSHEAITRNILLIDTDGARVGQINALSVLQLGGFSFGRPSRVTARVRVGSGKLVDIEREAELGGPLHSKGVMILSGYLATHYAPDIPMSLWASIVFEQSYGGVDGDSASAAELFALLSALSEVPIDQSFAVTGSVNQFGDIQAIGGVNEKIEGFFDICAARGLTGRQAVLIPAANVKHLALRQRVIDAVAAGQFRIIPIRSVNQGLDLLTGRPAGARDADGIYEAGSINRLTEDRLRGFAEARKGFITPPRPGNDTGGGSA
ncbi:Lon protease family protein [Actibacterium sp. D379-3]